VSPDALVWVCVDHELPARRLRIKVAVSLPGFWQWRRSAAPRLTKFFLFVPSWASPPGLGLGKQPKSGFCAVPAGTDKHDFPFWLRALEPRWLGWPSLFCPWWLMGVTLRGGTPMRQGAADSIFWKIMHNTWLVGKPNDHHEPSGFNQASVTKGPQAPCASHRRSETPSLAGLSFFLALKRFSPQKTAMRPLQHRIPNFRKKKTGT